MIGEDGIKMGFDMVILGRGIGTAVMMAELLKLLSMMKILWMLTVVWRLMIFSSPRGICRIVGT